MFDWNDDNIAEAKRLFLSGMSHSEVAIAIRCPSRNAVVGKLTRLGITRGGEGKGWRKKTPDTPKPVSAHRTIKRTGMNAFKAAPAPERPVPPPIVQHDAPGAAAVTLMALRDHHCRWPHGDPGAPDFRFCGEQRIKDSSYCCRHHLIAYPPPNKRVHLSQAERVRNARLERKAFGGAFA